MSQPNVILKDNVPSTNSRDVAEYFGKRHKDVLRRIKNLCREMSKEFGRRNFTPSSYLTEQGREQPSYDMTKKGFTLLVFGFTGKEARQFQLKYIERFEEMEAALKQADVHQDIPRELMAEVAASSTQVSMEP